MTGPQVYSKAIMSLHYDLFGENLNFNSIGRNTDITFSKKLTSYRIYGIDYNNKFTFKFSESEYLYLEKEPWRNELAKKELLHPKLNVDNVYVCHYKKLEERKKSILEQFKEEKIYRYEFIENFDKTKWDVEATAEDLGDTMTFSFESAWAPPIIVFAKLAESFPEIKIVHSYIEEGMCFVGKVAYAKGYKTEELYYQDPEQQEWKDLAIAEFNWEPYEE